MPPSRRPLSALFSVLILAALLVAALPACAPGSASEEAAADTTALKATQIAAGEGYAMALLEDSTVVAWGSGLLPGRDHLRGRPYLPSRVEGLPPVCKLGSTSGTFALAIACDGTLWSWGSARNRVGNSYGRLGRSVGTRFGGRPAQIAGLRNVVDAAAGNDRALAVTADGTVYSWGQGGNLARSETDDESRGYPMPRPVEDMPPAQRVAASIAVSFVVDSNGTVWSWGLNGGGDLGRRTEVKYTEPLEFASDPLPRPVEDLPPIRRLSAGATHALAVSIDDKAWSWGLNNYGQLGRDSVSVGTDRPRSDPKSVQNLPKNVAQIATGSGHSLALSEGGTVWSWGINYYGQLGRDSASVGTDRPHSDPKSVQNLSKSIMQIVAGGGYSLALSENGTIYGWGANYSGELGREAGFPESSFDEPTGRPVPRPVPLSEERLVSFDSP